MGIRQFDVMDLGKASLVKPEQLGYKDSLEIIKDESYKIQKSFVKIGWYLKHIRDHALYSEGGYANIWECAADQLGYSQSTASRFINICEKFSKDHNSPELDEKYAGFDKSQMIEMLPMEPEQLDRVSPDMTVKQIRDIKKENKESGKKDDQEADDNIPGQTSLEKDFPEYMPKQGTEDLKEDISDLYATSHKEDNDADPDAEEIIDGEYREIEEQLEEKEMQASDKDAAEDELSMVKRLLEIKKQDLEEWMRVAKVEEVPKNIVFEKKTIVGALASMVCDLENTEPEPEEIIQPELPVLKNNDQRKEWLAAYKSWGLWYRDENIDVNYYKYDFSDGSRLVVAEYPQRHSYYSSEYKDEHYYHLLEKNKQGYRKPYDEQFRQQTDSETYLVEFLKDLQKKG